VRFVVRTPGGTAEELMAYPIQLALAPTGPRNRLTTALRIVLAIPHTILVGPVVWFYRSGTLGLLGAAAYFLAFVNWCSLLVTGTPMSGARDFALFYLRWRTRVLAYTALLVDAYPPFGDGPYPAAVEVREPTGARDRASIALRPLLVLPHIIVLLFVTTAWFVTTVVAWVAILVTGQYPRGLYDFGAGTLGWLLRVEGYLLLLVDEFPAFAWEPAVSMRPDVGQDGDRHIDGPIAQPAR
jgi:hypothetical protein